MRRLSLAVAVSGAVLFSMPTVQAQTVANEPRWSFLLGVKEDYETRVRLSAAADRPDLISRVGGILSYNKKGPRLHLSVNGSGAGLWYKDQSSLSRFTYIGGLAGNYVASPRLSFNFGDSLTSGYTYDHSALVENGLLLPLVLSRSNRAAAGLIYQVAPKTTLNFDVRHDLVKFNASGLIPGTRFAAATQLKRQVSQSSSLGVVYTFNRHANRDRITYLNALSAAWVGTLTPWLDMSASLGFGWLQDNEQRSDRMLPVGSAGLRAHFQHTTLAARYRRTVTPAYGFGRDHLADTLDIDLNRTLSAKLTFLALATLNTSDDPYVSGARAYSQNNLANFKYAVTPDLSLVAGYSYRNRRGQGPSAGVHSHGAQLSLSYALRW